MLKEITILLKSHFWITSRTMTLTGCAKKKKDILNIHIKSEEINIFSQKFG